MAISPASTAELQEAIAEACGLNGKLEIRGGGTKAGVGAPDRTATILDMSKVSGIVDFDPAELILTVRAGTPLREVEALVASQGQMLAFAPYDHALSLKTRPAEATIGGIVAAGVAGSRRLSRGGARDHLLGFTAVSGRGEMFVAGGKVVKNVTGYDLPKLATGSWGRLMALSEITLKVLPAPRDHLTQAIRGLTPALAYRAMAHGLGSQAEIAAAAYLPGETAAHSLTLFRLEGFAPSVAERSRMLEALLAPSRPVICLDEGQADSLWRECAELDGLAAAPQLWRLVIPARAFPDLATKLDQLGCRWLADWGGGLVWVGHDGPPEAVRAMAEEVKGHAALWRGPEEVRRRTPCFHPHLRPIAALEERVRRAFDPAGVFETGRFGD